MLIARKSGCLTVSLCTFVYLQLLYSLLSYHVNCASMIPDLVFLHLYTFYHESWQVNELRVIATKLRKVLLPVTGPPKEAGRDLLPARLPTFLHLLVTHTRLRLLYRSRPGPVRVICIPLADYTFARLPETRVQPRLPSAQTSLAKAKSAYYLRTLIHPLNAPPSRIEHPIFPTVILATMLPSLRQPCSRDTQFHFLCLNSTSIYRPCLSLHFLRVPGLKRIQREKSSCH
jgi:hypothetical protein